MRQIQASPPTPPPRSSPSHNSLCFLTHQSFRLHLLGEEALEQEEKDPLAARHAGGSARGHRPDCRHRRARHDHRHPGLRGQEGEAFIFIVNVLIFQVNNGLSPQIYNRYEGKDSSKHKRNLVIAGGVTLSVIVSPVVAAVTVGQSPLDVVLWNICVPV